MTDCNPEPPVVPTAPCGICGDSHLFPVWCHEKDQRELKARFRELHRLIADTREQIYEAKMAREKPSAARRGARRLLLWALSHV